jgi:hypothetical protein
MLKQNEITDANSCLNKARRDEMMFILLARDPAAPATIRFWVEERIRLGKNNLVDDPQIIEAWDCAHAMEVERLRLEGEKS